MDYPKSVPNVGLVDGKFVDENPSTGQVGSLIPSAWGNSVTQELLNVIKAAGLSPDENQLNQLLKAIQIFASSDIKKTVKAATTGAIALSGLQSIDGVTLISGDRVLVKNQATASQNGVYTCAVSAWVRAQDADENIEISPAMMVPVQSGKVNYGSVWQLTNILPPEIGITAINFEQVIGSTGIAAGTYKSLTIDRRGRAVAGSNPTTLKEYGIVDALPNINPLGGGSLDLHGGSFGFVTSSMESSICQNCWWDGTSWLRHDPSRPAVCLALERGTVIVRKAPAGANPIFWNASDQVIDVSNLTFAALRGKPTTLSGYGITDALTRTETATAIQVAIAGVINGAPGALDTLKELSDALGGDPNFANTIVNALADKAPKATTLEGYNITNGLPIRNPLGGGSLDLHGGSFAFVTSLLESSVGQNCYWNGASWLRHDVAAPAVSVTLTAGRIIVRKAPAGANPILWAATPEVVDSSMVASIEEAESGANIARWMNPFTVARYVAKKVVQATEFVAGIAGVASINQVNAGTDDATIVTPKKLKWGFSYSATQNGYICFPSWLGGFMLQWGFVYESQSSTDYRGFTVPFPTGCLGMVMSLDASTVGGHGGNFGLVTQILDRTKFSWSVGGSLSGGGYGYYLAWGA